MVKGSVGGGGRKRGGIGMGGLSSVSGSKVWCQPTF